MFSLNKSLNKLKESIVAANLAKDKTSPTDEASKVKPETEIGVSKQKKSSKQKKTANKNIANGGGKQRRGVILIKNFPHGFYEKQMFDYFSQFGEVTRLKIARSRKTGNPKSYGFVEFQFEDVAKIAAETMNDYIMFDHIVKCSLLPEEKVPKNLFLNWNRPFISSVKTHKVAHNKEKSNGKEYNLLCKRLKRVHSMEKALSEKGIQFKCVLANRPTGLSKGTKEKSTPKLELLEKSATSKTDKSKPASSLPQKPLTEVILESPSYKKTPKGVEIRRRLLYPKFMVTRAGFKSKF